MKRQTAKYYADVLWQTWKKTPATNKPFLLQAFLELLQTQRALKTMPRILDHVQILEDAAAGVKRVTVEIATEQDGEDLHKQLKAVLGPVAVDLTVNRQLIAGLKLQIGDELIDGSVATQLQRLQTHLSATT